MAERNSFVMYMSWATLLANLPEEQAGILIKAICAKQTGAEYEITDPVVSAMFSMIESQLDKDTAKYNETCRNRSDAGRKGNEKRWTESQAVANDRKCDNDESQNIANGRKSDICDNTESQNVANVADNESEYESENESESDTENESENEHPTGAKKKNASARPARHKHGQFGHVLLTDDQFDALVAKHGSTETENAIRAVDEYCEQSGKTYRNYALVMEKWGYRSAAERARSGTTKPGGFDANDYLMGIINGGGEGQ